MRFPSKVTPYKESIIAKFPIVLAALEYQDMMPRELYAKTKKKVGSISEFIDVLDCLYALNKIEMEEGLLHYVG